MTYTMCGRPIRPGEAWTTESADPWAATDEGDTGEYRHIDCREISYGNE